MASMLLIRTRMLASLAYHPMLPSPSMIPAMYAASVGESVFRDTARDSDTVPPGGTDHNIVT